MVRKVANIFSKVKKQETDYLKKLSHQRFKDAGRGVEFVSEAILVLLCPCGNCDKT
jgi:hypothetical protein